MSPPASNDTPPGAPVAHLRSEVAALRNEIAEVRGQAAALDASLDRIHVELARGIATINDRLDTMVGIRSKSDDLTARVTLLEKENRHNAGWRDRIAWLYAGAVTTAGAIWGILKALGKL